MRAWDWIFHTSTFQTQWMIASHHNHATLQLTSIMILNFPARNPPYSMIGLKSLHVALLQDQKLLLIAHCSHNRTCRKLVIKSYSKGVQSAGSSKSLINEVKLLYLRFWKVKKNRKMRDAPVESVSQTTKRTSLCKRRNITINIRSTKFSCCRIQRSQGKNSYS